MRAIASLIFVVAFSSCAWAEIITTTDGRTIEINSDGTYRFILQETPTEILMIEQSPFFEKFAEKYNRNSIGFMPIFRNETGKTVVGFKFETDFNSAFGEGVISINGESSERILNDSVSTAGTLYIFEDNPFIGNEPFDKLSVFKKAGTGTIVTRVTAVVFEGGEVLRARN